MVNLVLMYPASQQVRLQTLPQVLTELGLSNSAGLSISDPPTVELVGMVWDYTAGQLMEGLTMAMPCAHSLRGCIGDCRSLRTVPHEHRMHDTEQRAGKRTENKSKTDMQHKAPQCQHSLACWALPVIYGTRG